MYEIIPAFINTLILFISFSLILTLFGYSILSVILLKSSKEKSKSLIEISLISFGVGVSVFISYAYILAYFNSFNLFTAYITLLIYDLFFLIYKFKNMRHNSFRKVISRFIFKSIDPKFMFFLIFYFLLSFTFIWIITTSIMGLYRRDPYMWVFEFDYLLKHGTDYFENRIWIYPSGFVYFISGFLLPENNFLTVFTFVKFIPIIYFYIYITASYIIFKKYFSNNKQIIIISLILILVYNFLLSRLIINVASTLATLIMTISFLIILDRKYPNYLLAFFGSAIYLIHPLSAFYYMLILFSYYTFILIRVKRIQMYSIKDFLYFLICLFILLIPYLISNIIYIKSILRYYFSLLTGIKIGYNTINVINLKQGLFLSTLLSNFLITFPLYQLINEIFHQTIGIFFIFTVLGLLIGNYKRKKNLLKNFELIFIKIGVIISIIIIFLPSFSDFSFLVSTFNYRILESFSCLIVLLTSFSIKWCIDKAKFLTNFFKRKSYSYSKLINKYKKKLKLLKFNHIVFGLIFCSLFSYYINKELPRHDILYADDIVEMHLYLGENAPSNSTIYRPEFLGWVSNPNTIDYLLYNMKIFYYYPCPLLDSLKLILYKNNANYLIFDRYPNYFSNELNVSVQYLEYFNGKSNILRLSDYENKSIFTSVFDYFNVRQNGSIRWYFYRNESISDRFNFLLYDENFKVKMSISINDKNEIFFWNGTSEVKIYDKYINNMWNSFKIDFECGNGSYENLNKQKFNLYFNDSLIASNISMLGNNDSNLNILEFKSTNALNLTAYINNLEYSWDSKSWITKEIYYKELIMNSRYTLYKIL